MQESKYNFDLVRINSEQELNKVNQILNDKGLSIKRASDPARLSGYNTKIEMVAPSKETLAHLKHHEDDIWPYSISYVEIAKDMFFTSDSEANTWVGKQLQTLHKKWSSGGRIYDQYKENKNQRKKRKGNPEHFGTWTGYFGSKDFEFVIYARKSKLTKQPCAHFEWRIRNSSNITRKTEIISVGDLVGFDCKAWFESAYRKFIIDGKIDIEKLGRFLIGIDGRRKILSKSHIMKIDLQAYNFLRVYEIATFSDLVGYFRGEKKRIKHQKGRKSEWDRKILSITNYSRFKASIL